MEVIIAKNAIYIAEKKTKGTYRDCLDDLNKSLSELENGDFKINRQEGWLEMDMKAGSLFESGTADLTPEALVRLMQLAAKIKEVPFPIVVEGYTDDIPIETPQFPSNWELSATRAATVARVLNSYGISTDRILVTGYGAQYPVADNLTEEGRGLNRRVNIVIAKDRNVDRLINPRINQVHNVMFNTVPSIELKKQNTNKVPSLPQNINKVELQKQSTDKKEKK